VTRSSTRDRRDHLATPPMFDDATGFTYTLCLGSVTGDSAGGD